MYRPGSAFIAALVWAPLLLGQPPRSLTLEQAKEIALRNHPRIRSAGFTASAAQSEVAQARAPLYPMVSGSLTGAGSPENAAVAAGALTTSSLSSRLASGLTVNQLITDFGRTSNLAASADLRAAAQNRSVDTARAQVVLVVEQQYYRILAAQAVLETAKAALENRRLMLRQVRALAEGSFKSTLDVSFAEVTVSEAELDLYRAENEFAASQAAFSAAMGEDQEAKFELQDQPLPPLLDADPASLIAHAISHRPDLAARSLNHDAAMRFASAEKRLSYPAVGVIASAGEIPQRISPFRGNYGAAALNVTIPVLNGGLYKARREEAEWKAKAAGENTRELTVEIARDVRLAWLEANTAYRRLDVTARLVAEADQALRLAQIRYDNGLGSIVELNQAQLNQTSARIGAASAKYEYLGRRAILDYTTGDLP